MQSLKMVLKTLRTAKQFLKNKKAVYNLNQTLFRLSENH